MLNKIKFFDFTFMNESVKDEIFNTFESFYDEQSYIMGKGLIDFETSYAQYSKTDFCIGVANGLDAIILCLKVLNIGKNDEVLVPSNTYIATWLAVTSVGAKPIPVEPRISTYNINPENIPCLITNKTKAIIAVNLYGQPCEMDELLSIANKFNLYLIEDNAQSQGATYKNKKTGSFGIINATSFYPGKNLGALGDAGAITTSQFDLYSNVKTLRNYGSNKKYYNEVIGVNSRLDEIQARILQIKLNKLDFWNNERIKIANLYYANLKNIEQIELPIFISDTQHVYHQFVIRTKFRDKLIDFLISKGVSTLIHYPIPPHLQLAYKNLDFKKGDFPVAEEISETCLSLPIYPGLKNDDILYVTESIRSFFNKKNSV